MKSILRLLSIVAYVNASAEWNYAEGGADWPGLILTKEVEG